MVKLEVIGSLEHLKKEISDSYASKLQSFKDEQHSKFEQLKKELMETHDKELIRVKTELTNEEKKVYQLTFAQEQLKARKKFEKKREELISFVFDEARVRVKDILKSENYLNMIRSFIQKKDNLTITGSSGYADKLEHIQSDDSVNGIIVKQGKRIYDFTFEKFIESNYSILRHKISSILFENVS